MSIELLHVCKSFGGKEVLHDAHFTLPPHSRTCFWGPSGCGKTTLLRLICGLDTPNCGEIRLPKGTRFSCHFQEDRLLPWYSVLDNLLLTLPDAASASLWLSRAGLLESASLYPNELSGGMRRRLSLIRALACPGDVLVLDEPLRELDTTTARAMLALIDEMLGERTLLLVSHNAADAQTLGCTLVNLPL